VATRDLVAGEAAAEDGVGHQLCGVPSASTSCSMPMSRMISTVRWW